MKVTYTSYTAVAEWKWDLPEEADKCGICRMEFESTCPTCVFPGQDCPILIGACTHCFHMHCVSKWLYPEGKQGPATCPMCRQPWKEKLADSAEGTGADASGTPAAGVAGTPRTPATASGAAT